uniref:Calponin-homology (CH) domain-containing protein n=1 Tax=Xenopus tropicalis TaxID=8364 RepID=A0A1B8XU82_XENTR
MKDISDGAALLTIIHFYCPEQMKLDDICLKEVTSIADSLYNIQLLKEFSNEYLNKCFFLTLEDMLYSPLVLKPNVMVFIAELFWWFENVKPDFVQPRDTQELKEAKVATQPKSSRPQVPISNATKRSFLASPPSTGDCQAAAASDSCSRNYLQPEDAEKYAFLLTIYGPSGIWDPSSGNPLSRKLPIKGRPLSIDFVINK